MYFETPISTFSIPTKPTMQETTTRSSGHPKGLYILFATEMWERFNFYGMRSILALYMLNALMFNKVFTSSVYGGYLSLVYLSPLLGGFIADRYWGNRRSIITGGLVMAVGEGVLFFSGTWYQSMPQVSLFLFFTGLGLMITGNGFFKPNISSLVGQLYPKHDNRKDVAYTIFYMGINTGGAVGPLICGLVGDTNNPADFRWAFLAGGIGMLISVAVQLLFQRKYVVDPDKKPLGMVPANAPKALLSPTLIVPGIVVLAAFFTGLLFLDSKYNFLFYLLSLCFLAVPTIIFLDKNLTKIEKDKVIVIFTVCFFVIFFWAAFEQAGASLTYFASEQTQRKVDWLHIPIWLIAALSVILVFYIARLYTRARKNLASAIDSNLRLTVSGLLLLFGIALIALNFYLFSSGQKEVSKDEIPTSWFQSLNSAFVVSFAAFFAWMWTKMGKKQPSSITKLAIGLFMLGMGYLWIASGVKDIPAGIKVSMLWLVGMYALHTMGELCLSPIGMSLVNSLSPIKYSSLLMGIWFTANGFGNKLAGVMSTLYPPGAAEVKAAHDNGIDLAPILASKTLPPADVAARLDALGIPYKFQTFLGIHIDNLYDFFMLFLGMAVAASILLFILSKKLQKMMHEDKNVLPHP